MTQLLLASEILDLHKLQEIQEAVKIPFRFIFVSRNPFDIAATKMLSKYSRRKEIADREKLYKNPVSIFDSALSRNSNFHTVRFISRILLAHFGKHYIYVPSVTPWWSTSN